MNRIHQFHSVYEYSVKATKGYHYTVTQGEVNISQSNQFTTIINIQVIYNQCDTIYAGGRWVKIKVIIFCKNWHYKR